MFDGNFRQRAVKRALSAQPFVGHDAQRILIAGWYGMRLKLFRRHVGNGSGGILGLPGACDRVHNGDAEVAQQDFVVAAQEHIFRFDVTVNQVLLMSKLQGVGYLAHVGEHDLKRETRPLWMTLAQVAVGSKVDDQKGCGAVHTKVEYLYNMRMA